MKKIVSKILCAMLILCMAVPASAATKQQMIAVQGDTIFLQDDSYDPAGSNWSSSGSSGSLVVDSLRADLNVPVATSSYTVKETQSFEVKTFVKNKEVKAKVDASNGSIKVSVKGNKVKIKPVKKGKFAACITSKYEVINIYGKVYASGKNLVMDLKTYSTSYKNGCAAYKATTKGVLKGEIYGYYDKKSVKYNKAGNVKTHSYKVSSCNKKTTGPKTDRIKLVRLGEMGFSFSESTGSSKENSFSSIPTGSGTSVSYSVTAYELSARTYAKGTTVKEWYIK